MPKIFANECSHRSQRHGDKLFSGVNDTGEKKYRPVSLTPAINPCHGFFVIAGVVETGNKFITMCR
jgi:hypothetical protein